MRLRPPSNQSTLTFIGSSISPRVYTKLTGENEACLSYGRLGHYVRPKMEHVSRGNSSCNKSGLPIDDDG